MLIFVVEANNLLLPGDDPDFPAHLDRLDTVAPAAWRDGFLRRLGAHRHSEATSNEVQRLVADRQALAGAFARRYADWAGDEAWLGEIHGLLAEVDRLADDGAVAAVAALPEAVTQHDDDRETRRGGGRRPLCLLPCSWLLCGSRLGGILRAAFTPVSS